MHDSLRSNNTDLSHWRVLIELILKQEFNGFNFNYTVYKHNRELQMVLGTVKQFSVVWKILNGSGHSKEITSGTEVLDLQFSDLPQCI